MRRLFAIAYSIVWLVIFTAVAFNLWLLWEYPGWWLALNLPCLLWFLIEVYWASKKKHDGE